MNFEVYCFVKCMPCIIIEKHLVKFAFKLTFANTNVTESSSILKKTKKTTTTKMSNLLE